MSILTWARTLTGSGRETVPVSDADPMPVSMSIASDESLWNLLRLTDPLSVLAMEGRVFYAADGDQNDLVTGQTSFVNTTPTFLLDVPLGTVAVPLFFGLNQAGTVGGGDILIAMEMDKIKRYASGGTAEASFNARTSGGPTAKCTLYSNPTAVAGYGVRTMGVQVAADISPAEGAIYELVWTPAGSLDYIVGPGAWLIYSYAGTTGPSFLWTAKWLEVPIEMANPRGRMT